MTDMYRITIHINIDCSQYLRFGAFKQMTKKVSFECIFLFA